MDLTWNKGMQRKAEVADGQFMNLTINKGMQRKAELADSQFMYLTRNKGTQRKAELADGQFMNLTKKREPMDSNFNSINQTYRVIVKLLSQNMQESIDFARCD